MKSPPSGISSMEIKEPETKKPQRWTLRRKLLVGAIIALVALGIALGLGIGLTRGEAGQGDDDSGPSPSLTPVPTPTNTLAWTPKVDETWQIILSHPPVLASGATNTTPDVSIFDIDLFDTPLDTINQLHKLGKKVICYFSAGSYEDWRPDAKNFTSDDKGKDLDGWPGEKWLRLNSTNVRDIMAQRIKLARQKNCDGIDPDNVDGYSNDNGLSLTENDSVEYMQYLSSVARPLNLTMGLKNAGDIITAVLPIVEFSVNEQCLEYGECDTFRPFIDAGKPVFHIEYPAGDGQVAASGFSESTKTKYCNGPGNSGDSNGAANFSTVLKNMNLDGWVEYCDGSIDSTDVDSSVGGH